MLKSIRKTIHKAIKDTVFEGKTYLAGGCVRDEILGIPTQDIDIAVELPEGGIKLARYLHKQDLATKPVVYKQFGTALVMMDGFKLELVMTRKESYRLRSRKPNVCFGTLEEDVLRRDFTINSLLMDISAGNIIDVSGQGLIDLKNKVIRATSRPDIIFKEDPLRLLRAVRFATTLGFTIERNTQRYIKAQATELKHISRERIAEETIKILSHQNFLYGINLLINSKLKQQIFPGLRLPAVMLKKEHSEVLNKCLINLRTRLAYLLWHQKNPSSILKLLKLSNSEIKEITKLIVLCKMVRAVHNTGNAVSMAQYRELAYFIGKSLDEFITLYPATTLIGIKVWQDEVEERIIQRIRNAFRQLEKHRFNLTGDDLIQTFCITGPKIRSLLNLALMYWFEKPSAAKEEILAFLQSEIKKGVTW